MENFFQKLVGRRGRGGLLDLPSEGPAPEFAGLTSWLNGGPLTLADLRGRVVLLVFWTHSCVNCLRALPRLQAWHENYYDHGLVIIGVHTPEFSFEGEDKSFRHAVARHGLTFPVALDPNYETWKRYGVRYWPAHFFIDAKGLIRTRHYGEGGYADAEMTVRRLLAEAGRDISSLALVSESMPENLAADEDLTRETHLGWDRQEYLGSPETVRVGLPQTYSRPPHLATGIFYLQGEWRIENEHVEAVTAGAKIFFRVRAARVFLTMEGPAGARVRVAVDGSVPPEGTRGADLKVTPEEAVVTIDEGRLYSLLDWTTPREATMELTFLEPGTRAYDFSFS